MKTLDEVIKAVDVCSHGKGCEHCCYRVVDEDGFEMYLDCPKKDEDVLQWLKGYKAHIELDKLRDKCEAENEPLTWSELKLMEGNPIWMEYEDGKGGWVIVGKFFSLFEHEEPDAYVYMYYLHNKIECSKELYGSYWKAYRKERK